ncbi:hypothetical protein ABW19_dt0207906 [Dactylella cylindrospora]|nr:hypothetical protein ABW19_dt0207906 [Dactylella cylindrospora]
MRLAIFITGFLTALAASAQTIGERQKFKVRTKVIEGNRKFNGLWASLYHTGAGTADVYFHGNEEKAFLAFLNNTQFQWIYSGVEYIPYSLNLRYQTYAAWGPLEVTPGYGDDYYGKGFVFGRRNQVVSTFEEWTGWLGEILPATLNSPASKLPKKCRVLMKLYARASMQLVASSSAVILDPNRV